MRGRYFHKRSVAVVAPVAVALVLVAAAASRTTESADNKILTIALGGIPTNIDPAVVQGRISRESTSNIAGTLVRYKSLPPGQTRLQGPTALEGEIAKSWTKDADGSFTFTLRSTKSEFGNPVTSQDVKWTFDRAIAVDGTSRFLMDVGAIKRSSSPIEVIDEKRFRLRTTSSTNPLTLAVLVYPSLGILDSTEAQKRATPSDPWARTWLSTNSASTAAYRVEAFTPGVELRLAANPNYWARATVKVDKVVMRSVPDPGSRLLLIRSKQIDFTTFLTFDLFKDVAKGRVPGVASTAAIDTNVDLLWLNTRDKLFQDQRVRQAISLAIDRKSLIQGAYSGFGKPALYPMSSAIQQPEPPKSIAARLDVPAAKALLTQAGYPNGFTFTLTVNPTLPGPWAASAAALIQSQLRKVGITMNIQVVASPADFQAGASTGKYQAWLYAIRPVVVDPAYLLFLLYTPRGISSYGGYSNAQVNKLTGLMLEVLPGKRRNRIIASTMRILAQESPVVPLVETVVPWVSRTNVKGARPHPAGVLYPQFMVKG